MIQYLKGVSSSIITAMIALYVYEAVISGIDFSFTHFIILFMSVSAFAYILGLLGISCWYFIKELKWNMIKSCLLFLALGLVCGFFLEMKLFEGDLIPAITISTTLGSLAFLVCQQIKNRAISYTLSALPFLIIGLDTLYTHLTT
ncbi:hypothetical protein M3221_16630 [Domibacillus indicus]|uniref:hypothetical protein n=1 Tax=Domibacillus indicus TaxID=1437523 RepID=UPI0020414580|nr:hypothetical protein [Domibacillus indicus]MCM3790015.1 hypothetical protein [Domibacillus indicus]